MKKLLFSHEKLKEISKQTHEAMIKNMEISIPELEEELKRRKERKIVLQAFALLRLLGLGIIIEKDEKILKMPLSGEKRRKTERRRRKWAKYWQ